MGPIEDYHQKFHSILGHLTTIRSACSVIVEDYQNQLPAEVQKMLAAVNERTAQMVAELEDLRNKLYQQLTTNN